MSEHFKENIWECWKDPKVCLISACIPGGYCCLQAHAVDKLQRTGTVVPYLGVCFACCFGGMINRAAVRDKFSIKGKLYQDCLIWYFCPQCAACQEYREARRYDSNN